MSEIFIIDTNTLITPYKTYYPFDIAPSFWNFLSKNIISGNIVLLNKVFDEVVKGTDDLSSWLLGLNVPIIDNRNPQILANYSKVLAHIQANTTYYNGKALAEWSDNNHADAWLVATAMAFNYKVISFETKNNSLGTSPSSRAKIPDICSEFNVQCGSLYTMMRALGFTF